MRKEIEQYITKNYYELLNIAKRITKNHELSQDLFHEVILQLYSKEDIELQEYSDNQIRYYIVSIIRINWISKTSPFHYRVRREMQKYVEIDQIMDMTEEQETFEKELIFNILEMEYAELNWFHKSMMEMYMVLGSLRKVSLQTDIPIASVARYVRESKQKIKDNMNKKLKDYDN